MQNVFSTSFTTSAEITEMYHFANVNTIRNSWLSAHSTPHICSIKYNGKRINNGKVSLTKVPNLQFNISKQLDGRPVSYSQAINDKTLSPITFFMHVLSKMSMCVTNIILFWLLADLHSFKCFSEHGNSKTVNDRIYDGIGQTRNVENLKDDLWNTSGT